MTAPRRIVPVAIAAAILAASAVAPAHAAPQWKNLLEKARKQVQGTHADTSLPQSDIVAGLKEALAQGTTNAIRQLGRTDGFWSNAGVRIPLPGALRQVGDIARKLGQGEKVDAFQLSLNRAAEKAVPQVADIFGDAIRAMTLDDARKILGGGDDAATQYFRRVAGDKLATRIRPIVARATDSVGVTRRYKALTASAGNGALGGLVGQLGGGHGSSDLDLDQYVTDKTLDGLFATIASEEKSIRHDPAARTTDLLKKVFGGH